MFYKALTTGDVLTENGMPTNSTSSNAVLDLFFKIGGWNQAHSENEMISVFSKAFAVSPDLATKCLFYNRDIRGGQGRRHTFRTLFRWLCIKHPEVAIKNLENVPFYGRWDDLFVAIDTKVWHSVTDYILHALKDGDKLCAKWMPRENKSLGKLAKILMDAWELSPKKYRKLLAGNTEVVESLMCKRQWSKIDYNHVPSVAINKYRTAFYKRDGDRFPAWIESLSKPESGNKIHADAIYPHDIVKKVISRSSGLLDAQWKALPNYMPEGRKILPVCDTSGSMSMFDGEPMLVCVALGLYLSERNVGPFKDGFITFSDRPVLQMLHGSLSDRVRQLNSADWGYNTNLEAVFRMILAKATESKLAEEDMPDDILILSDMQFDQCVRVPGYSALKMIRRMYETAGYRLPNVIFWNLRTSSGVPAKFDESGVALVSGFSPSIMKNLLGGNITPIKMMLSVLESERYSRVSA